MVTTRRELFGLIAAALGARGMARGGIVPKGQPAMIHGCRTDGFLLPVGFVDRIEDALRYYGEVHHLMPVPASVHQRQFARLPESPNRAVRLQEPSPVRSMSAIAASNTRRSSGGRRFSLAISRATRRLMRSRSR
jgi:hypothetical protein